MMPKAWLLNLDADLELMRPLGYHPSQSALRACTRYEALARKLLDPSDIILQDRVSPVRNSLRGFAAAAWCPTPSARRSLHKAGAKLFAAPPLSCLQRVNHRSFNAQLGQMLRRAFYTEDMSTVLDAIRSPPAYGWMVKRAFGFAARHVRRFGPSPSDDDFRWLRHALARGGVQVEPWLHIIHEYSLHGYVDTTHNVRTGVPCVLLDPTLPSYQRVDDLTESDHISSTRLLPSERQQLQDEAERVAHGLIEQGYFGPFGIDAFAYHAGSARCFNPRSEINARYTLAYATGMGGNALAGFSD